ncbi:hypothetical protein [Klebsiella phage 05F01]|nr:hypothetical protein [Klebsiella phage 05F01]
MNYYIISQAVFPIFLVLLTLGYFLSAKVNSYKKEELSGPLGGLTKSVGLKFATITFYLFDLTVSVVLFAIAASEWWYVILLIIEVFIYLAVCLQANKNLNKLSSIKTS